MGGASTKLLTNLDIGPIEKEEKLKKEITRILTSGLVPKTSYGKSKRTWKSVRLNNQIESTVISGLINAVTFIHEGRSKNENVYIDASESRANEAIAFAAAYFMMISGLSAEQSYWTINTVLKPDAGKSEEPFLTALQELQARQTTKELRGEMFKQCGPYSFVQLTEDVEKIYELSTLPKPTSDQVRLEAPPPAFRPRSLSSGSDGILRRKSSTQSTPQVEVAKQPTPSSPRTNVTSKKTEKNASKQMEFETVFSGAACELEEVTMIGDGQDLFQSSFPFSPASKPSKMVSGVSSSNSESQQELKDYLKSSADKRASEKVSQSIYDIVGKVSTQREGEQPKSQVTRESMDILMQLNTREDTLTYPDSQLNEKEMKAKFVTQKSRIIIIRNQVKPPTDTSNLVDDYLKSIDFEERRKNRKKVVIVRAYSQN